MNTFAYRPHAGEAWPKNETPGNNQDISRHFRHLPTQFVDVEAWWPFDGFRWQRGRRGPSLGHCLLAGRWNQSWPELAEVHGFAPGLQCAGPSLVTV